MKLCRFNGQVGCKKPGEGCAACGWNPEETARRAALVRGWFEPRQGGAQAETRPPWERWGKTT